MPRCTKSDLEVWRKFIELMPDDPYLLSDLEVCGPVADLEKAFAGLCNRQYALALSSGTAAIHTALLAARIGPGEEVITSPYSWPQTLSPIPYVGATLVFPDVFFGTRHLNSESVIERISAQTKALVVPHLFGHISDMVALEAIAKSTGILLISDAAQAMGATLDQKPVGEFGDVVCFSLGRGKLVTAGEGGVLVTDDYDLFLRAVQVSQHQDRYWRETGVRHHGISLNYRMHPVQATLALKSLAEMDDRLQHRRGIYRAFMEGLGHGSGLDAQVCLPSENPAAYGIPLVCPPDQEPAELIARAQELGIPLRQGPVGTPLNLRLSQCGYPNVPGHWTHQKGACPVAEELCVQELWVLSALDMDSITSKDAFELGRQLRGCI